MIKGLHHLSCAFFTFLFSFFASSFLISFLKKSITWQVCTVPAERSEVAQRLWHQKESFGSLFVFGSAHGPSGKCHLAFWRGPTKKKVFEKHCCVWHFLSLLSIPRPTSWRRVWWCWWWWKADSGKIRKKPNLFSHRSDLHHLSPELLIERCS